MTTNEYPRLCGGTFFTLVLQALRQRMKAREHYSGDSDGLSDPEVLVGLIKVINPDYTDPGKENLKVTANNYKACKISNSTYLPFDDEQVISAFDSKVRTAYQSVLNRMLFFSNVDTIDPTTIRWSAIRFQRNNNTYRMLISLCQLILEGMLLTTDSGEYKLASFVDEQRMNRLYEKFILEYYAKECPQVTTTASQIPWALDDGIGTMLPVMQSDIMLTKDDTVLIIDAKYYTHTTQTQYDVHTLHSGNLYQIFTYVKNKDTGFGDKPHTVSGMLLYAATDEAIQPDNSYQMSGNKISVRTLDLNQEFSEIATQLNTIVDEHFSAS